MSTLTDVIGRLLAPRSFEIYVANGERIFSRHLPARQRFGIPLCDASGVEPCVNRSGSMNYASATAWVAAMNAANYLGHSNWQLPTTPYTDPSCAAKAPPPFGNSFGFGCNANALGYLYYKALGFQAPNTAVPIPPNRVGPSVIFNLRSTGPIRYLLAILPIFRSPHAARPVLELKFDNAAGTVSYRWKADEPAFAVPIRVEAKDNWQIVQPTSEWKRMKTDLSKQ